MKKDKEQSIWGFYKTFYKANKPVILVAIILLALLPISLYILACTPSPIGFMSSDDARAWLGYYGAIAGGGMTLSGVAWTINNQRKLKEDDLYPILIIKNDSIKQQADDGYIGLTIPIENVGTYEAKNIFITVEQATNNHYLDDYCNIDKLNMIPKNASDTMNLDCMLDLHHDHITNILMFNIIITYDGFKKSKCITAYQIRLDEFKKANVYDVELSNFQYEKAK